MKTIPIVILNYNSSADCRKCVSFLRRQDRVELELVLVDNSSRLDDLEQLRALARDEGCTLFESKENRGYNAGNNIGLRYAVAQGYEYALIANPDMEFPQTDYVIKLVEVMKQDEDVVVVGSDIVGLNGVHQNPIIRDRNWHGSFTWLMDFFKKKSVEGYDFVDNYCESHYCGKVSGCCLLVRLDFLRGIDFFDEQVFLYCEEAILSRQVEQAGKKMYYLAEVQAVHAHVKSAKGDPVQRFEVWKQSRIYFIERYSGDSRWGKWLAKLSMRLYVGVYKLFRSLKR